MRTFIVDSFTDRPFHGNPAGVCLVDEDLTHDFMLKVAGELGLSETAFVREVPDGYAIRYFSPKMEIPLCGHATLAAAKVVFGLIDAQRISFCTRQDIELCVWLNGDSLSMEFPAYSAEPSHAPEPLLVALGVESGSVQNAVFNAETRILLLQIESSDVLRELTPDFSDLLKSHDGINGVLVTAAAADEFDFHSRYFWPWSGTNEDPVTGGTHTFLAPYWASRLGKTTLRSFQSSARTGSMTVEVSDGLVRITGSAVVVLSGQLEVGP